MQTFMQTLLSKIPATQNPPVPTRCGHSEFPTMVPKAHYWCCVNEMSATGSLLHGHSRLNFALCLSSLSLFCQHQKSLPSAVVNLILITVILPGLLSIIHLSASISLWHRVTTFVHFFLSRVISHIYWPMLNNSGDSRCSAWGQGRKWNRHFSAGACTTAANHRRTGRQVRILILTLCALSLLVDFPTDVFCWKNLTLKPVVVLAGDTGRRKEAEG